MTRTVRRRRIDLDRVRSRLYTIVLEGEDRAAIAAARVLLLDAPTSTDEGPKPALLDSIREALVQKNL